MPDTPTGRPVPLAVMTEIDGVVAVYSAAHDQVMVLSPTASDIWRLLDGVRSEQQVVEAVAELYDMPSDSIASDVSAMIACFREKGLLEMTPPVGPGDRGAG